MYWSEDADATPVMPAISPAKTMERQHFTGGNPRMHVNATVWDPEIANIITNELLNLVEGAGIKPEKQNLTQVLEAVKKIAANAGRQEGTYEATPNTLALRNNTGRTQVADPVEPLDAVNMRTLQSAIGSAGTNVKQPSIISPEPGTTMQSLSFQVTGSAIELTAGGTPLGDTVNWRVISADKIQVLSFGSEQFTTTPTITVPETSAGSSVLVLIQYSDVTEGFSAWSETVSYTIASTLIAKVPVLSPFDGESGVLPNGLTVEVGAGAWTDGSAFEGAQSRLILYAQANNATIWDSGWREYTTSFAVPHDTLTTQTSYWAMAQHRAASAPAGNPDAVLTSPTYGITDPAASSWTTLDAAAPDVSGLEHTIPPLALQGTQKTFTISGAVSRDSGAVTYNLINPTGGVSFSKTEGITDGEEVTMFVPSSGVVLKVSVQVQAQSSFGAKGAASVANTTVLTQTVWTFTANATWTPPAPGLYNIKVGGGGGGAGGGDASGLSSGAGGGGYAEGEYQLGTGSLTVIVGAGGAGVPVTNDPEGYTRTGGTGGTSSVGSLLSATGGSGGKGRTGSTSTTIGGVGGAGLGGNIRNLQGGNGGNGNGYASGSGGGGAGHLANGGTGSGISGNTSIRVGGVGGGGATGVAGGSSSGTGGAGQQSGGAGGLGGVGGGGAAGGNYNQSPNGGRGSVIISIVL